jgi:polar amino acid transport system permease protein
VYVELFRNIPPLILLLYVFFALPQRGLRLDSLPSAIVGLSIYGGAFVAEALRGGMLSVNPAHLESARALGLSHLGVMRLVLVPIALRAALPSLTNVAIALVKTTALAGALGIPDLMGQVKTVQAETFRIFDAYGIAALCYLAIIAPLSAVSAQAERRFARMRLAIGGIVAVLRATGVWPVSFIAMVLAQGLRSLPSYLLLLLTFFGLQAVGVRVPPIAAVAIGLALYHGARVSEIIRSATASVESGQVDAARSLGLSRFQTLKFVLWPPSSPR